MSHELETVEYELETVVLATSRRLSSISHELETVEYLP